MANMRWKIAQKAEIRWWQNYLHKKPKTDYLDWKRKYWENLLNELELEIKPDDYILDAGCGPAGIFMLFEKQQVDAVDPLLDEYEQSLKHFSKIDYPDVNFYTSPLETFEDNHSYDKVFCLNAINHVDELGKCFDKLVELTKSGGKLIVSIDAHNYQGFKHLFKLIPGDILHPHQYDLKEYQQMLLDRDCQIEKTILFKKEFLFNYYILIASVN